MKISEVIRLAGLIEKGNVMEEELAVLWLSELDGMIQTDIMLHSPEEIVRYSSKEDELLLKPPHDGLYVDYLVMKIRQQQQEYEGYQNAQAIVDEKLKTFRRWYVQHYRPADSLSGNCAVSDPGTWGFAYITAYGLAVQQGYRGTLDEWLQSLKGETGEAARMRYDEERETVQWGVGEQWYDLFTLSELRDPAVDAIIAQAEAAAEAAEGHALAAQTDAQRAQQSMERAGLSAQNANAAAEVAEDAAEAAAGSAEDAEAHANAARQSEDNSRLNLHEAEVAAQEAQAAARRAEEAAANAGQGGGNGSGQNASCGDVFGGYDRFYDSIARMQVNPTAPLDIQTYDGSNKPTHPKVLYFADGWAGRKYWLTYSPFPDNNNTYENPCIAYSEDGINWTSDGISNPIEDTPKENGAKVGYNSDPHLVMVDGVMECWWRTHFQSGTNANHEVIFRKTSVDGIHWSEKEELFRVLDSSAGSCLSPAVIFEDGVYKIWTVYKQQVMRYYESATGRDWQHIRDINVDNPDYPTYKVWHIDVIHSDKGYEFVGCYHPTGDYNDNRYIYYAVSQDNITYSNRVLILTPGKAGNFDATELYRPAILRLNNKVRIYYGCRNGGGNWRIGMIEAPTPYLFNAVLRNGLRFDALESRLSALESGSGGSGGDDSGDASVTHSITYKLTNCTSSNGATSANDGASYSAKLSTSTGYTLGAPTITMGGVDITSSAWNATTATITIASVTDDVVITCSATADSGGDSSGDDMTVVDSFADSAWNPGYYNDEGVVATDAGMYHSQLVPVGDYRVEVPSLIGYLRVSYFDEDKKYITYDRGAGVGVGGNLQVRTIMVDPSQGAYFAISYASRSKDVVVVYTAGNRPAVTFQTTANPTAEYIGSNHGGTAGEWAEQGGGNGIAVVGGTWNDGVLSTDGVDDYLTLPLTGARTVTIKIKPMTDYAVEKKTAYVFDCRTAASAYLLNYGSGDYIGDGATVYADMVKFEKAPQGYKKAVISGEWNYITIVFASAFTGNMVICAHNSANSDYMQAEIEEIKVYDVDITAG